MNSSVRFAKMVPDAKIPTRATEGSSGLDLYAVEPTWVRGSVTLVRTGIAMEVLKGYDAQVRPRSGLTKNGVILAGIGTIDSVDSVASVALGTARIRGELDTGDRLTTAERAAIAQLALERSGPIADMLERTPGAAERVIASGGTVRALARLAMGLHRTTPRRSSSGTSSVNQVELPAGQLRELADRLATLDLDARMALPGIQAKRAPLLPIGAVVLSTLVDHLGLRGLVVSEWGLREGAVLDGLALNAVSR